MENSNKSLIGRILFIVITTIIFIFLLLPTLIIVLSAFSPTEYVTFPPSGFSIKWFKAVLTDPNWSSSIQSSLKLILFSVPLSVIIGTLAAYGLHVSKFKYKSLIKTLITSPIMMPAIILGIGFLYLSTSLGLLGSMLILIIGHTLVSIPYVFRSVTNVLTAINPNIRYASLSLGASQTKTFFKVIMPNIIPGIISGAIFASVISLGEVSISLLVSSSQTSTVPVQTMSYIDQTFDPSVNAVAVIFIFIAIIVIIILEKISSKNKVRIF